MRHQFNIGKNGNLHIYFQVHTAYWVQNIINSCTNTIYKEKNAEAIQNNYQVTEHNNYRSTCS